MAWRLARSLERLRAQVNAAAPNRSKSSDGTIGDAAHASRSSDHNPYIKDGGVGVVRALDLTHDPKGGMDSYALAETLRASGDPRIRYIISNYKIANSGQPWRKYSGSNPHSHHVHISVSESKSLYDDTRDWQIGMGKAPLVERVTAVVKNVVAPKPNEYPMLKRGSKGAAVRELQTLLKVKVDGDFGLATLAAVRAFQRGHKLVADGIVGSYTWRALRGQ
jgi:peptidoglycan hydrolase-like protein with peptidoglycan-binding domain